MSANITAVHLMRRSAITWACLWYAWLDYQASLRLLERKHDLETLVRWAEHKNNAPHAYFLSLLYDTERQLFRKRVQTPWATSWAQNLYRLSRLLFPTDSRHSNATKYRLRKESLMYK